MITKILKVKGDWREVLNDCRSTVGKEALGKEPSDEFKVKILIAEHSPIRDISIKWMWEAVKSWCATHWSRHKWECFIETRRSDRTGVDRGELSQDELVKFTGQANVQHLIDTMRKRLCYQASPETRKCAEDLKCTIWSDVDWYISDVLVPNCVYRGGCPEMQPCGWYEKAVKEDSRLASTNIRERYDAYNDMYEKRRRAEITGEAAN